MSDQDRYVPGVPVWVDLTTPDPRAAGEFYGGLFGWTLSGAAGPGDRSEARLEGGAVAGVVRGAEPGWTTYVLVDSLDGTAERVRAAGGEVHGDPVAVDGARLLTFSDPEGLTLGAWEAQGRRGADVVNAHGSVNFNDLYTHDLEAAVAFYGAVFGWRTMDMGGGSLMWALDAYGDHLEERTPGTRESYAAMGGPAGFENVVASVTVLEDGSAPARWGVTFAVDDADAAAEATTRLGGEVVSGPYDASWVRMAEVRDPHGAAFVASQFVPPS